MPSSHFSRSMAWSRACGVVALLSASQPQGSAAAFQCNSIILSRGLRGAQMTSFRNAGDHRNFEVKTGTTCWGRSQISFPGYSTREAKTICNALPNSSASKVQAQMSAQTFAQFLTKIAVTLGCFAGLFLQDALAQEYNAVDRFPLVNKGKV
jgi:hypothetical protein